MNKKLKLILGLLGASCLSQGMFAMPNGSYIMVRSMFSKPEACGDLTIADKKFSSATKPAADPANYITHQIMGDKLEYEKSKNFSLVFGHLIDITEVFGAGIEIQLSGWYSKVKDNHLGTNVRRLGLTDADLAEMYHAPLANAANLPTAVFLSPKDLRGGSVLLNAYGELYVMEWNTILFSLCAGGGVGGYVNVLRMSELIYNTPRFLGPTDAKRGSRGLTSGGIAYNFMFMARLSWENLMGEVGYSYQGAATHIKADYRGKPIDGLKIKWSGIFVGIGYRF
jgi:hypothetical protein